ncbi:glycohydrolase toxin TNT-related protein [Streptomyces zingiberis]|uniref:Glycohydrolase toxin TNT-related protein n=1 Tax=Streptomyces zingiberis TaxID=2053010 RepID=A0ABX1BXF0_9ACTN|nr:glycohydrolase toxin TNT-related protein [Streptomyces zingiberis]NJQ02357.1 glycohydrolase toxin TNT-related protein [Streptomyces zingiberis]
MRHLRTLLVLLGTMLALGAGSTATALPLQPSRAAAPAQPGAVHHPRPPSCPTTDRTPATNRPPAPPLNRYYLGDWRLGPKNLPQHGPLARMLRGYERLDGYTPASFLACYWNDATAGWWYPSPDGWVLINGVPLKVQVELEPGQKVDLFGSGFGNFLAPAGTPFAQRALPPSNLNTLDPAYPFGYHLYEVVEPFTVEAGPARAWFGQPGGGIQYRTAQTIPQLVTAGKLKTLN